IRHPTSEMPHFLSMTATPIPRTLHLALDGDLDLSVIKEMPKNRKKVLTKIVENNKRQKAYEFIQKQIGDGRQIFVICPLIDPSDKLGVKSVSEEYEKLNKKIFPDIKIEILHGKLKAEKKEKIMQNFLNNKTKVLVATSVVEVGVDIPNATIIMIEGAERFGLAQLHQFRGRVGRSAFQSYCFLFSDNLTAKASNRLEALVDCNDGFELARRDLEFRGAGDIYGQEQSGLPKLKIATLFDYELMQKVRDEAEQILTMNSELEKFPELKNRMKEFEKSIHLE
ncbi:DNA helicase RecG, partial [Candidatus Parcubacteria bacterium]|nr:DNA helicase RecG [Candidatus Parcubacteria bacterium]